MKKLFRNIGRRGRLVLVGMAAVQTAVAVFVAVPSGVAVTEAAPLEERAEALRFRTIFGLPTDGKALDIAGRTAHAESVGRFGTKLTPTEFADMAGRIERQNAIGPMATLVDAHNDQIGPLWIDQARGGQFVQAVLPGTPGALKAAIAVAAPPGANLRFVEVKHSIAALTSAAQLLADQQVEAAEPTTRPDNAVSLLRQDGFDIVSVGAGLGETDRVLVYFESLPATRRAALDRHWDDLAGRGRVPNRGMVAFGELPGRTRVTETRFDSPGTLKGGIGLTSGYTCTSNLTAVGASMMQMTAGHCWTDQVMPTTLRHAGKNVGVALATHFVNGSNADVRGVQIPAGGLASPYMMAAVGCATCVRHDVAQTLRLNHEIGAGQAVCHGGTTTNIVSCGTVTAVGMSNDYGGGIVLVNQVWANYAADGGDSGAVVGNGGVVYGIQSGMFEGTTVRNFSTLHNALGRLNRSLLTASPPSSPVSWGLLRSRRNSKCSDVSGNNATNGSQIWLWSCNANPAQQFSFVPTGPPATLPPGGVPAGTVWYELKWFSRPGKCADLDVAAGGLNNGAKIQTWDCNALPQQKWYLTRATGIGVDVGPDPHGYFTIRSGRSNKCIDLDISGGGNADGTRIQQWDCNGQSQQHWYIG